MAVHALAYNYGPLRVRAARDVSQSFATRNPEPPDPVAQGSQCVVEGGLLAPGISPTAHQSSFVGPLGGRNAAYKTLFSSRDKKKRFVQKKSFCEVCRLGQNFPETGKKNLQRLRREGKNPYHPLG